jgi:hypothetical protein
MMEVIESCGKHFKISVNAVSVHMSESISKL